MKNEFNRMIIFVVVSFGLIYAFNQFSSKINVPKSSPLEIGSHQVQNIKKISPSGIIVTPLTKLLTLSQRLTSNYGLAIILMTLLLRVMLTPLQFISMKSMKKMKEVQPELLSIKEKFINDPNKVRNETLKLFKEKSVNPFMGFIPVLLQMPLFFGLYKLLNMSSDIVGANFAGWLTDLSLPDPLYILPILAGILQLLAMFYSSNESHNPNMSGKIKFVMTAVFTGLMLKMPAAILLYTITSSVSSMVEKGVINKIIG